MNLREYMRSRIALVAAPLAALLFVGALGSYVLKAYDPRNRLERAYAEKRTLELRINGASHSPVTREVPVSHLKESTELLRAEAMIVRRLQQNPDDMPSLNLYGLSSLLLR